DRRPPVARPPSTIRFWSSGTIASCHRRPRPAWCAGPKVAAVPCRSKVERRTMSLPLHECTACNRCDVAASKHERGANMRSIITMLCAILVIMSTSKVGRAETYPRPEYIVYNYSFNVVELHYHKFPVTDAEVIDFTPKKVIHVSLKDYWARRHTIEDEISV